MATAIWGLAMSGLGSRRGVGLRRYRPASVLARAAWLLLGLPVLAGFLGTLLPAFGYLPALGRTDVGWHPWWRFFELPGCWTSIRLSWTTGFLTTALSLGLAAGLVAVGQETAIFRWLRRGLPPLLAVPHVAVAFGFAFLISPSGWLLRALSPWLTGFELPPDWRSIQDEFGLALVAGLVLKETPFLVALILAALPQADATRAMVVARTFGYRRMTGWFKVVFPRVYPQIRLGVFAVLAYGMSVVDVAMILGPTTPAPLGVRLVGLFHDPDLEWRLVASAGAVVQLGLVLTGIAAWCALERGVRRFGGRWIESGRRGLRETPLRWMASGAGQAVGIVVLAGLAGLAVWSVAGPWRFPSVWPREITWAHWERAWSSLGMPALRSVGLAAASTAVALVLAVAALEAETEQASRRSASMARNAWLYLPLLVPQVAFLFGVQILLARWNLDGTVAAVLWLHVILVHPYVFLALADAYRAWDERHGWTALCLGASPWRVLYGVKWPMLARPIASAAAVGFAVSMGLYLPTLFAGAGRISTVATEAVALSAGGDPRQIGVHGAVQGAVPLLVFAAAVLGPAWWHRNRRGMRISE